MGSNWFQYWKSEEIDKALGEGVLSGAYGNQLSRVAVGDIVWIVGQRPQNRLVTIGNIFVAKKQSPNKRLSRKCRIFAANGAYVISHEVSLMPLIRDIEFASKKMTQLDPEKAFGQQLHFMLRLTETSAHKVDNLWNQEADNVKNVLGEINAKLSDLDVGDRPSIANVRKEQQKLRDMLLGGASQTNCFICGKILPVNLLVASHIKRRSYCNTEELRDLANVAPMCRLGCDSLFELGYIMVQKGRIISRKNSGFSRDLQNHLTAISERNILASESPRRQYLDWHFQFHSKSDNGKQTR